MFGMKKLREKFKIKTWKAEYEYQKDRADSNEAKLNYLLSGINDVVKKVDDNGAVKWTNSSMF